MTGMVIAAIGVLFVAPFVWSALVALARRQAAGRLHDLHEKALLALMLAPIGLGAVLLVLPQGALPGEGPPLLDWVELPGVAPGNVVFLGEATPSFDWVLIAGVSLLALYAIGVARSAIPLINAHMRLRRWIAAAHPYPEFGVHLSERATTPLAVSKRRVLFPRRLVEALTPAQIQLIVAHERHHHTRGDVALYAVLAWIDVALWFNPFVRAQTRNCRLAAELDCDAAVTAAAPEMRRAYAETLLAVLKHAAGDALQCAPAVFSHRAYGEHRMRILQIMKRDTGARKRAPWFAYVAALALAAPLGVGQLALAQANGGGAAPVAAAAPVFSHVPVAGRLTSGFGERVDPFSGERRMHAGSDIAAPIGTPIIAPAAGRVIQVVMGHEGYGNMIEVDHGGGYKLRYAQLSRVDVSEGQSLSAGQRIGLVGTSGRATGPHLHLEVWRDNVAYDPALIVPMP